MLQNWPTSSNVQKHSLIPKYLLIKTLRTSDTQDVLHNFSTTITIIAALIILITASYLH